MENKIFINGLKIENAVNKDNIIEIEGYCCHYQRANLNKEIIDENSFKKFFEMYKNDIIRPQLNYNHDSNMLIGGIDELVSFDEGLYMRAHLNKAVKLVSDMILPLCESGDLCGLSTEGVVENGYHGIVENEDGTYYVKDFILLGVALTPIPADWDANFSLKNYLDEYKLHKEEEKQEIEKKSKWYLML